MKAALINIGSGAILGTGDLPFRRLLPDGGTSELTAVAQEVPAHAPTYRVMQFVEVNYDRPGLRFTQGVDVETRNGNVITSTRQWTAWTPAENTAYDTAQKTAITAAFDNIEAMDRALTLVIQDEMNLHALRIEAMLTAANNAATFAAFKTAMAAIAVIPQRTPAQIKTAIFNKLGINP